MLKIQREQTALRLPNKIIPSAYAFSSSQVSTLPSSTPVLDYFAVRHSAATNANGVFARRFGPRPHHRSLRGSPRHHPRRPALHRSSRADQHTIQPMAPRLDKGPRSHLPRRRLLLRFRGRRHHRVHRAHDGKVRRRP